MTSTQPELTLKSVIREARLDLGLSQRELARRVGMSPIYVNAVEAGRIKPSIQSLAKLQRELRLTPHDIFKIVVSEVG